MRLVGGRRRFGVRWSPVKFRPLGGILDMVLFCRPDDRRGDAGLLQHPSQRDLGIWDTSFLCYLRDMVDDLEIIFFIIKTMGEFVAFGPDSFSFILGSPPPPPDATR